MSLCCTNTVIPIDPCSGNSTCIQNYSSDCVLYNGTYSCGNLGVNPTLTAILNSICTTLTAIPNHYWTTSGNAGTTAPANFIGTLDNNPLSIKINNLEVVRVLTDGTLFASTSATNSHNIIISNWLTVYTGPYGQNNTVLGANAYRGKGNLNTAIGVGALFNSLNGTGSNNTGLGANTLGAVTSGNNNTGVGEGADVGSGTLNYATAIGSEAIVEQSNSIVLGRVGFDNVGIGTTTPDNKAILELTSTTQGFLIPRMTTTEKNNIASPPEGLIVYDLTLHLFTYFNGTSWV